MKLKELNESKIEKGYSGFELSEVSRVKLLELYPPKYKNVIAHHCTYKFPAYSSDPLPPGKVFRVVGHRDDENGLEALVIEIDGSVYRADGSLYHITYSLNDGRKPVQSNEVLKKLGYESIQPIAINMTPKFFKF